MTCRESGLVILWRMTAATDEQKKNLAEATLRLVREMLRVRDGKDGEPDNEIGAVFGQALFECPADGLAEVPELLKALCPPEELPDVVSVLDDFERVKAEPPAAGKGDADGA